MAVIISDLLNALNTVYCDAIYNKKIIKKIGILNNLNELNIPILNYSFKEQKKIFDIIKKIAINTGPSNKHNTQNFNKLNSILGDIVHNALESSGYNLMISNFPEMAISADGSIIDNIIPENIYYTLAHVFGEDMIHIVVKICDGTYIIHCKDAKFIKETIDCKMVGENIIKVDIINFKEKIDDNDNDNEYCNDKNDDDKNNDDNNNKYCNGKNIEKTSRYLLFNILKSNVIKLEIFYNTINFICSSIGFFKNKLMFWR